MRLMQMMAPLAALIATLGLETSAVASDGVLEINQTCAIQGGCVGPLDFPGFPVTVNDSGSYRLTSNLIVPNPFLDGILILANDVHLDLNGFSIIGAACAATMDVTCRPASGTGTGIKVSGPSNSGCSATNGSILGMGSHGILLGAQSETSRLRVRWNHESGIVTSVASTISNNLAMENGRDGIAADGNALILENNSTKNGRYGIHVGGGGVATVVANSVSLNLIGISNEGGGAVTASENTAFGNIGDGIQLGPGATVLGNSSYANGGDGISVGLGAAVVNNTVRGNGSAAGYGISLNMNATYRGNTITDNRRPVEGGVNIGDNYCAGDNVNAVTCP